MDIHRAIKHIAEENNGIIRANDMVKAGLGREILARLAKDGGRQGNLCAFRRMAG